MIHLIITTANIPKAYWRRKWQYIRSIKSCLKYGNLFDTYTILECVTENKRYLNKYNTYYSKEGNPYPNKGLNEMAHLKAFLRQSTFKKNDAIIKLTGRYIIDESYFFNKVIEMQNDYDSIFKDDSDVYEGRGYHTFFYYIKKGLLEEAIDQIDFSVNNDRPIEWDMKDYLKCRKNHLVIDRLGITAYQGTKSEKIFKC
ncbi:MAG TPA: hypothetical protein VNI52_05530 [Sphingobacteriaceae bacterium]|nr:hypothetical protein [Sphingobacteriaceae bacterium]